MDFIVYDKLISIYLIAGLSIRFSVCSSVSKEKMSEVLFVGLVMEKSAHGDGHIELLNLFFRCYFLYIPITFAHK